MAQGIFLIQSDGSLLELAEEAYDSESLLQELIAKYPNLLSGDQSHVKRSRRWLLIGREIGVPDEDSAGDRWSLDHLFLDQDGIPTLVEVKRSSDSRIRREVVGQLLDYAANAVLHWSIERIQTELESSAVQKGLDFDLYLRDFLGPERDISEFWQTVRANLLSGRIRLIFVADEIPRELQRIVEFLNQQMSPAEVYAIEVRQYAGAGIRALVPRLVGVTASADLKKSSGAAERTPWDKNMFLDILRSRPDPKSLQLAEGILDWVESRNCRIDSGTGANDGALYPMLRAGETEHYLFALRTRREHAYIQILFKDLQRPFDTFEKRRELADKIEKATGQRLPDEALTKFPGIKLADLDEAKVSKLLDVFDWYAGQCKS